jgi:hypothetical protein
VSASEIGLGDLIRAVRALGLTTDAEVDSVAAALGLAWQATASEQGELSPLPIAKARDGRQEETFIEPSKLWPHVPKTPRRLIPVRTEPSNAAAPPWFAEVEAFPAETQAHFQFVTEHTPLLPKHQMRAIFSAALAVRLEEGEIDTEALVDSRARREPIERLPRRPVASLRRGVQVLLDRREAMMPFFSDQNHLVEDLKAVIGQDRMTILQFLDQPEWVIPWGGSEDAEQRYSPPLAPGTPILLVSDLGIGVVPLVPDPINDKTWLSLATRARQARCPLVALVPYPANRWPADLSRSIPLLEWDRATRPGVVRRRVGPGHPIR